MHRRSNPIDKYDLNCTFSHSLAPLWQCLELLGNGVKDQGLGCILQAPHETRTSVISQVMRHQTILNMQSSHVLEFAVVRLCESIQAPWGIGVPEIQREENEIRLLRAVCTHKIPRTTRYLRAISLAASARKQPQKIHVPTRHTQVTGMTRDRGHSQPIASTLTLGPESGGEFGPAGCPVKTARPA